MAYELHLVVGPDSFHEGNHGFEDLLEWDPVLSTELLEVWVRMVFRETCGNLYELIDSSDFPYLTGIADFRKNGTDLGKFLRAFWVRLASSFGVEDDS